MDKQQLREKIKAEYVRFNHQLIAITARVNATGEYAELEEAEEQFYSNISALIPDIEELDKVREEIFKLNSKLSDREIDLIKAKREERERILNSIKVSGICNRCINLPTIKLYINEALSKEG